MSALRKPGCKASTTKCDFSLRERPFETTKNDVNCILAQFLKNDGKANFYATHGRRVPCRACRHHAACLGSCQACQACRWTLAIHVGAWRSMPVTPATLYLAHFAGAAEPSRSLILRAGLVARCAALAFPWLIRPTQIWPGPAERVL